MKIVLTLHFLLQEIVDALLQVSDQHFDRTESSPRSWIDEFLNEVCAIVARDMTLFLKAELLSCMETEGWEGRGEGTKETRRETEGLFKSYTDCNAMPTLQTSLISRLPILI